MSSMLRDFREFIGRSNVLGLAVAVVMGAAFGGVITSFVNDILMQLIAALGGRPDFAGLAFTLNGATIRYGRFINALLTFLVVAFSMFLVVRAAMKLQRPRKAEEKPETEVDVLRDIRESLRPHARSTS